MNEFYTLVLIYKFENIRMYIYIYVFRNSSFCRLDSIKIDLVQEGEG